MSDPFDPFHSPKVPDLDALPPGFAPEDPAVAYPDRALSNALEMDLEGSNAKGGPQGDPFTDPSHFLHTEEDIDFGNGSKLVVRPSFDANTLPPLLDFNDQFISTWERPPISGIEPMAGEGRISDDPSIPKTPGISK